MTGAAIAAVLFDMDGTLVDSDAAVARAWAHWSERRGVAWDEIARVTPGRPASESMAELAPWLGPETRRADAADLLARERADLVDIVPTPGAVDLVAALVRGRVPYAVVTSADDGLARARLAAAGLDVPEVLITADSISRGKPDPEGYLTAAGRLGVPPHACLVVEDTLAGVRAGLAAGATVAAVRDVPEAHLRVRHLSELAPLLPAILDSSGSIPDIRT
ncbi:MAG TPA: HAD-IA family hydrolase [Micromonosporaceae bacterium]|nr:HAD-IA family hydrolase [Micromonosporaceae bacterium]